MTPLYNIREYRTIYIVIIRYISTIYEIQLMQNLHLIRLSVRPLIEPITIVIQLSTINIFTNLTIGLFYKEKVFIFVKNCDYARKTTKIDEK